MHNYSSGLHGGGLHTSLACAISKKIRQDRADLGAFIRLVNAKVCTSSFLVLKQSNVRLCVRWYMWTLLPWEELMI